MFRSADAASSWGVCTSVEQPGVWPTAARQRTQHVMRAWRAQHALGLRAWGMLGRGAVAWICCAGWRVLAVHQALTVACTRLSGCL